MAVAYMCDRCGTVWKKNAFKIADLSYRVTKNTFAGEERVDLCPKCTAELERFMKPLERTPEEIADD